MPDDTMPPGDQGDAGAGAPVPAGQPEPLPGLGDLPEPLPGLRASLEAILLVMDEPVDEVMLAQVLERPRGEVSAVLHELSAGYTADGRGFDLREVAGGWRFYTRSECAPVVERFLRDGQEARLTQAALETLAVVAYRQPVSRSRVSAVRGVNCDGVMRTLTLRGLVEEAGTDQETSAILYRTTSYFLERLGLRSLEELPDLAPFLPEEVPDDITEAPDKVSLAGSGSDRGAERGRALGDTAELPGRTATTARDGREEPAPRREEPGDTAEAEGDRG